MHAPTSRPRRDGRGKAGVRLRRIVRGGRSRPRGLRAPGSYALGLAARFGARFASSSTLGRSMGSPSLFHHRLSHAWHEKNETGSPSSMVKLILITLREP